MQLLIEIKTKQFPSLYLQITLTNLGSTSSLRTASFLIRATRCANLQVDIDSWKKKKKKRRISVSFAPGNWKRLLLMLNYIFLFGVFYRNNLTFHIPKNNIQGKDYPINDTEVKTVKIVTCILLSQSIY